MQIDEQVAVSSAAEAAPVASEAAPAAPRELTEDETRAYLTRADRTKSVEDVIMPSEAKSDTADKSEATKEAAIKPEADTGKQPGRGLDKRLSQLAEKNAALRQQLAEKAKLTEALRQYEQPAKQPAAVQQQPEVAKAPKLADFDDFDAYEAAREAHFEKLAEAKAESKFKAWQEEQSAKQVADEFSARAKQSGVDPDHLADVAQTFAAMVKAGEVVDLTQAMYQTIADPSTEAGPAVALHLMENPSEVQRIAGLSPVAQVRELDKLAATLKGEAPAAQPQAVAPVGRVVQRVSAASAPVPELGGGNASDPLADAVAANDFAAFEAISAAKRRGRG